MSSEAPARVAFVAGVLAVVLAASAVVASGPRFLPDDPIAADDDRAVDASGVRPLEDSNVYDYVTNTFFDPGERKDVPAMNVNTMGEVPDSSWFVNRIGVRDMSLAEIVRGPDRFDRLDIDGWPIVRDKGTGLQPGFRVVSPDGRVYQIEFDPPSNPGLASGAEVIGTAFYHAFGYHVVDVYVAELDPAKIAISDKATILDRYTGRRRPMARKDVDEVLARAARQADGKYRVLASRFADGEPLGNFRYYGTRPDDPNDIFPHEHRRELRANRVFAAWLNHDDSRGVNSLDMLEEANGKKWVRHYMFDFGSIMGSGTLFPQTYRAGNEYILEWKPGWLTLASLGFYFRPWIFHDYPKVPRSLGRFEGDDFDAVKWRPEYPNAAFENLQPDDAFWAARIVARFTPEMIRAIVAKARYPEPDATDALAKILIERQKKVLQAWLTPVNPVVDVRLGERGALTFGNAAMSAGVANPPERYTVRWFRFDNTTDTTTPVGAEVTLNTTVGEMPAELASADYVAVAIAATDARHPAWAKPATFYFRRTSTGWQPVGVDRIPRG